MSNVLPKCGLGFLGVDSTIICKKKKKASADSGFLKIEKK